MDNEKNISVTLKQNDDQDSTVSISFETLFKQAKKYFFIWVVLAAVIGMFTVSIVLLFVKNVSTSEITALVSFNYSGIESGLDPNGNSFDVNKIKSPNVIENALTNIDEPLDLVENIRRNISIKGIIPDEAVDKMSLYQNVYSKGGTAALDAVNSLLEIGYFPSFYVVSLNYNAARIDLDNGKKILNEILNSYQEYFIKTYNFNEALGNAIVAVDYKEYDYPAAVDVLNSTLDSLNSYINKLNKNDSTNFRSNTTGYSFNDLTSTINTIKSADLDAISSYITINNITNDKEQLGAYYQYRIERLDRELKVSNSKLESITNSIDEYEKDTLLVFGTEADNSETTYTQASKKYDELINQKIDEQDNASRLTQRISYYNDRIKVLDTNSAQSNVSIENVEKRLDDIYSKIENIIDITNKTADEYYENVTFAKAYNILVPATGSAPSVSVGNFILPLLITEGILFIVFTLKIFVSAILIDHKKNKTENIESNISTK